MKSMKRSISLLTIAVLAAGVTFAQDGNTARGERQRTPRQREQNVNTQRRQTREIETVTINGALKLERGFVAVESGENTILVPMLNRYIGFINGLQEGKTVSVEGFTARNFMHPQKLTIEGREYNFAGNRGTIAQGFAPSFTPRFAPSRQHAPQFACNCCGNNKQRYHAPQRNNRNREDRPNRENRQRRNAPAGSSQVITDQV